MIMAFCIMLFSLINILLAQFDARRIETGKGISHFLNGAIYLLMVTGVYFLFRNYWLNAVLLVDRLLVFNISLSLFRKLPWDYISPAPKSITDRISKFIFGKNGWLMYAVYLLLFVTLILLTYKRLAAVLNTMLQFTHLLKWPWG